VRARYALALVPCAAAERCAIRFLGVLVVPILLVGCAVGPDFEPPKAPSVARYTPDPLPVRTASATVTGGTAQRFFAERDIPGEWWRLFGSAPLDALIAEALRA